MKRILTVFFGCVLVITGAATAWDGEEDAPAGAGGRDPSARVGLNPLRSFKIVPQDRVVFLGGTTTERAIRYGYLETALSVSLGGETAVFRNLGWSGDDVRGSSRGRFGFQPEGFRHLRAHVDDLKPSVLVVDYGRNEAFEGEAGLGDFRVHLDALLDVLEGDGRRILLVAPHRMEAMGGKLPDPTAYNQNLKLYADVIRDAADRRGHWFVNLYEALPVRATLDGSEPRLTYNGLHLTQKGYRRLAEVMCAKLGVTVPNWKQTGEVRRDVVKKNELFFHRWRPQNETYLTLFRKHEQGNNYREIPQFDPLIDELEREIAEGVVALTKEVKP